MLDAKPILAGNLPTVGSSLPILSFDKVSHERANPGVHKASFLSILVSCGRAA